MILGYGLARMLLKPGTTDEDSHFFQDTLRLADLLICDECQELKNSSSRIASVVAQIPTPSRLGLTGSPLSNNLGEYYEMIILCSS
jgi:superfamily II DNA or RNA helicase